MKNLVLFILCLFVFSCENTQINPNGFYAKQVGIIPLDTTMVWNYEISIYDSSRVYLYSISEKIVDTTVLNGLPAYKMRYTSGNYIAYYKLQNTIEGLTSERNGNYSYIKYPTSVNDTFVSALWTTNNCQISQYSTTLYTDTTVTVNGQIYDNCVIYSTIKDTLCGVILANSISYYKPNLGLVYRVVLKPNNDTSYIMRII